MKKNITINLCGRLFNIDEDAYELLRKYLDTLHNYFDKQKSGDEIANDIEQRIAELLDELKAQGIEAINIEHVKEVIGRMGQPEEMASGETENTANTEGEYHDEQSQGEQQAPRTDKVKNFFKDNRFYRNPKDKMLAGVISGLASSFEVDVTLLRLAVVLLTFLFGALPFALLGYWNLNTLLFFVFIYLILAAIMPAAETPEEQLKMQGKPVNMSNLANEVVQNIGEKAQQMKESGGAKSIINGIMKVITGCLKAILILFGIALFFTGIAIWVWALISIFSPSNDPRFFDLNMQSIMETHPIMFIIFLATLLGSIFIPVYAIFYNINHRMGITQRIVLILIWISALATAIVTGAMVNEFSESIDREARIYRQSIEYETDNDSDDNDDGSNSEADMEYLNKCGWKILKSENCDRYTAYGQHYSGNKEIRYLDDWNENCEQRLTVQQQQEVQPGVYRLTAVVRSSGLGPVLWANAHGKKYQTEFPITGNKGGDLWQEASHKLSQRGLKTKSRRQWVKMKAIHNANKGKGYGWCRIDIDSIEITVPTTITYGISTDPDITGIPMHAQWFSACDVTLSPL